MTHLFRNVALWRSSVRCLWSGIPVANVGRLPSIEEFRSSLHDKDITSAAKFPNRPETTKDLTDSFGRFHNYLRISLSERCNLRCTYCMPEEGVDLTPNAQLLTTDEIIRISKLFVDNGVTKVRLTGGEPTVRKDLQDIVEALGEMPNLKQIGMTSNGIALKRKLSKLQRAGLTHINISLDTLKPEKFFLLTRRDGFSKVMESIHEAVQLGFNPVKINNVLMRGVNDEEIMDFVKMTKELPIDVRFIEYMPFDGNQWDVKKMIPYDEVIATVEEESGMTMEKLMGDKNDTAKSYRLDGHKGTVSFITSMSEHFCSSCNRVRMTADGNLKVCLFGQDEFNLRDEIRKGATDAELLENINSAIFKKKAKHAEEPVVSHPSQTSVFATQPILKLSGGPYYQQPSTPHEQRAYSTTVKPRLENISHVSTSSNRPQMVDVSEKAITKRTALARCFVHLPPVIAETLFKGEVGEKFRVVENDKGKEIMGPKGPIISTAIVAGTLAVKKTSDLIPFCHPLSIENCKFDVSMAEAVDGIRVQIDCSVTISGKTGVEMEALTGCNVCALTIYDMLKALSHDMVISELRLIEKRGGKSDITLTKN